MRLIVAAISLASLIMFPIHLAADTIVLKSGRKIDAVKCWELGDQIKCQLRGGAIIGFQKSDVVEVWKDFKIANLPPQGFSFNKWQSGISVHEAINIAEFNNLPLHRDGIVSENKTFNPKVCRPYADSASKFYYEDKIFGKWAVLYLDFTPISKKLYSIDVNFLNTGMSKDSKFKKRVETQLTKKYGKTLGSNSHKGEEKAYTWKISDNAMVTMRPGTNNVHLSFLDKTIAKLVEAESSGKVREGSTINDKRKF